MTSVNDRRNDWNLFLILRKALPYFLPFFLLAAFFLYVFQRQKADEERTLIEAGETLHLEMINEALSSLLREIAVDLKMLSAHHEMEAALEALNDTSSGLQLAPLIKEFVTFSEIKGFYEQIRLLDLKGMERIRVNHVNGQSVVVPAEALQNKSHRNYFKSLMQLKEGEFYLSPLDFSIENGQVERPLKAVLRIGVPLLDPHGQKKGLLILNYLGTNILELLRKHREKYLMSIYFLAPMPFG